jgi:transcriptional regulator with XRE-family HTH domain
MNYIAKKQTMQVCIDIAILTNLF